MLVTGVQTTTVGAGQTTALLVARNVFLGFLGLDSLRSIRGGNTVYVVDNLFLCLHDTVDWDRLFASGSVTERFGFTQSYIDNTPAIENLLERFQEPWWELNFKDRTTHPTACNQLACDQFCGASSPRCWNVGKNSCQRCPAGEVLKEGACVASCDGAVGFYTDDWACRNCDPSCKTCAGGGLKACTSCADTPIELVHRTDGSCGDFCRHVLGFYALNRTCINATDCPVQTFPNLGSARCDECDATCGACEDEATHCTQCTGSRFLLDRACVTDCGRGYFKNTTAHICQKCHQNVRARHARPHSAGPACQSTPACPWPWPSHL